MSTPPNHSVLGTVAIGAVFAAIIIFTLAIYIPRFVTTLSEPRAITNLSILEPTLPNRFDYPGDGWEQEDFLHEGAGALPALLRAARDTESTVSACQPMLFYAADPKVGIVGRTLIQIDHDSSASTTRIRGVCVWLAAHVGKPPDLATLSTAQLDQYADLLQAQADADVSVWGELVGRADDDDTAPIVTVEKRSGDIHISWFYSLDGDLTVDLAVRSAYWLDGSVVGAVVTTETYLGPLDGRDSIEPHTTLEEELVRARERLAMALDRIN